MDETHSLISAEFVSRLKLEVSAMICSMIIDTPTSGLMTSYLMCLNCHVKFFGRDFGMDFVCLSLSQLDVILRMNWLEFNHVFINCFDKSVQFLDLVESVESSFMIARQVQMSLSESAQVFMVFTSMNGGRERMITDLPMVFDFHEVFPDDISDLPSECEVEFAIDFVLGISPVSMAPYNMSAPDLSELKK
ncbi:uncharacterized protein LOC127096704 [Lathyrus oleraceus]|uniref:uncharacterized protein LOC127096704 n=1 Tax=Pisum sativum TaxID=3888 RepID=UPI0021D36139|nr:uncharacterized protein LOC127096704 [Pisum sativum]